VSRAIPRVALSREEAAAALGMSLSHFKHHVQPHVRKIHSGSRTLFRLAELERWARENETMAGRAA
jgi:hypothetical protein